MRRACCVTLIAIASIWLSNQTVSADEVVLTSGERFTSEKIWEEADKIRFNMHGLVVSVQKSDVASIIRNGENKQDPKRPTPSSRATPPKRPEAAPHSQPLKKPPEMASKTPRKPPAPQKPRVSPPAEPEDHPKINGIGLKGVSWRMHPTDFIGLTKISTDPVYGGVDQYWQPDGPSSLGNALLDGLTLGFWQNRLYTIMMWVDGKPGYQRLKKAVFYRYGRGEISKNNKDRFVWVKDETTDRLLEFDTERNIGIFWMRSRELDGLVKQQYPEPASG